MGFVIVVFLIKVVQLVKALAPVIAMALIPSVLLPAIALLILYVRTVTVVAMALMPAPQLAKVVRLVVSNVSMELPVRPVTLAPIVMQIVIVVAMALVMPPAMALVMVVVMELIRVSLM